MESVKLNLVFDGQRARPVTNTWKDAPPPRLTMGVKTVLEVRVMDRTGSPVDPFPDGCSFRFAVGEDYDPDTPAVYATEAVRRIAAGLFEVVLDNTRTAPMIHALGVSSFRDMGCELVGMAPGETWDNPSACLQFPAVFRNRIDSGDGPEPVPGKVYLTADNVGEFAVARDALASALSAVPTTRPTTADGLADKLEALVAALRALA